MARLEKDVLRLAEWMKMIYDIYNMLYFDSGDASQWVKLWFTPDNKNPALYWLEEKNALVKKQTVIPLRSELKRPARVSLSGFACR